MKISLTYFTAGGSSAFPKHGHEQRQSKQDMTAFFGISKVKVAQQRRMQTTRPLSNRLFPPNRRCYLPRRSFIKGNFKGSLIIKNRQRCNVTTQLFLPSVSSSCVQSPAGRSQALKLSVFKRT